jgi:hypothetical protein
MQVAATNLVQAGATGIRETAGNLIGNLAEQGAVNLIGAATENLPIPEGLKDAFSQGAKGVAEKIGAAVRDRIKGARNVSTTQQATGCKLSRSTMTAMA